MIPVRHIDTLLAFFGFILFIGTLKATLTTFDNNAGGAVSDGNLRIQLTTGLIYISTFALILFRLERLLPFLRANFLLLLFLLIPLVSVLWSVSPDATMRRAIALAGSSLFAVYIAFALPPERTLRLLAAAYAVTALASFATVFVLPAYGIHPYGAYAGVWRGVFATKNELGATMAMGTILLIMCPKYGRNERLLGRFCVAISVLLLLMSESRTAWVALVAVGCVVIPLRWISGRGLKTKLRTTMIAALALLAVGGLLQYSADIFEFMGKDATLTGRTDVWAEAIERAKERPLLGYGFRAYWTPQNKKRLRPTEDWSDRIGHAHNTYIDLLVELGLLGVVFFLILAGILAARLIRRLASRKDVINVWATSCLIFILVRGFAEATMLQHADIHWFYFVYFFAVLAPSLQANRGQAKAGSQPAHALASSVRTMKAGDLIEQPFKPYAAPGLYENPDDPGFVHDDANPSKP